MWVPTPRQLLGKSPTAKAFFYFSDSKMIRPPFFSFAIFKWWPRCISRGLFAERVQWRGVEMMNLSSGWRRRSRYQEYDDGDKFALPTRDDFQPIDTQEQEELVRSFEQKHAQQDCLWRGVFTALILFFVAFLIFSIIQQVLSPWEMKYHAYFMDEVESWLVISADWVAVLACLMAVKGLRSHDSKLRQQWMWYSCYTGLLLAMFWLYHMLRMSKFLWDVIWLPLGPLSGAGICLYVDHLLAESLEEVQKLRGSMYSYKAK